MIDSLIDKQDNIEIVRDQIAAILVAESANQVALAVTDGKPNPDDWKLRIFTERFNPWEQFLGENVEDMSPIINIWIDNADYGESGSNISERQQTTAIYNIDCYGYGESENISGAGHNPGDREASFEVQKAGRLVRNMLMADTYAYLALRGLVQHRWPQSYTIFQPQLDARPVEKIVGARIAFRVVFNELSPQAAEQTLELLSIDVLRTEDGQIVLEADYEYPL